MSALRQAGCSLWPDAAGSRRRGRFTWLQEQVEPGFQEGQTVAELEQGYGAGLIGGREIPGGRAFLFAPVKELTGGILLLLPPRLRGGDGFVTGQFLVEHLDDGGPERQSDRVAQAGGQQRQSGNHQSHPLENEFFSRLRHKVNWLALSIAF